VEKLVFYESAGRLHTFDRHYILYPPDGYRFIAPYSSARTQDDVIRKLVNNDLVYWRVNPTILNVVAPTPIVKAFAERFLSKVPDGVCLTFARNHPVFRKEPWIIHIEWPTALTGFNIKQFKLYKGLLERLLSSPYCKKITTWSKIAKRAILQNFWLTPFRRDIAVIPLTVQRKSFTKYFHNDKIKLIFVGSVHIPGEFEMKGGREVLEAFKILSHRYREIELVIRSDVPPYIREKYCSYSNIRFIDRIIPWSKLEEEFKSADIFLFPGHQTPFNVILDAMSYELAVVVSDAYANTELVEDGKTGLIIKTPERIHYFEENFLHSRATSKKIVKHIYPEIVRGLVEKTSILIEDEKLRRKLARAARMEVEEGKFSIKHRNEKLKKILDEAIE